MSCDSRGKLVLRHHFYNDKQLLDNNDQELNFFAQNLEENENPYAPFRNKSTWKPANTHISLSVFRQAFKTCLLNSKIKKGNKIASPKNREKA